MKLGVEIISFALGIVVNHANYLQLQSGGGKITSSFTHKPQRSELEYINLCVSFSLCTPV